MAIDGDTVVVGRDFENLRDGAAYIYGRNVGGPDNWGYVKLITASDDSGFSDFFSNVSIEDDTLAVGSGNHTHGGVFSLGAIYIFERNVGGPDNWGEVAKIVGSDVTVGPTSVGLSGDVAILTHGSHVHSDPLTFGTIFVFERNAGGPNNWGETQEIIPSDTWNYPWLSVDIDCGTIIIGDPNDGATGALYIFEATTPVDCPGDTKVVEIDIKPGSDVNPTNTKSKGVIPVAILTTDDFDATTVDASTVRFGPDGAAIAHKKAHLEDVDNDGDIDLVMHFRTQDTGIASGDDEACLTGVADGADFTGCDVVRVK